VFDKRENGKLSVVNTGTTVEWQPSEEFFTNTTVEIAKDILKDILITSQPVGVVIDNIIEKVSFTFGVTAEQVKSEKRDSNINSARQAAMYIIREITNLSQEEVGKIFGRNHSTVNSSLKNVQQKMSTDSKYKNLINDIIKNINN
jgi:chromosomal replication initiator protein